MTQECFLFEECNHKYCDAGFCLRKYKLDGLYEAALIPQALRKHLVLRIDQDDTDLEEFKKLAGIESTILDFVKNGRSLFIHSSNSGNGKTSWALRLIQAYFNEVWPQVDTTCHALYISVPRFLIALKDSISRPSEYIDYIKENILQADIILWDDIAAKTGTDYEINQLLGFIDGRIAAGKANIYTSNQNAAEMYESLGSRLTSRVANMSTDVELHGADKRYLNK